MIEWVLEVYREEAVLDVGARDLVQSVANFKAAPQPKQEEMRKEAASLLSELDARVKSGLINMDALIDSLITLSLLPGEI